MLRYKTETRPGLVALYDIRPGNGAGQYLQPRSLHGATSVVVESNESESIWPESESKSSWLNSNLGIYVAREPKNANFEKCNHKNLSTLSVIGVVG